ncbi:MAG: Fe-S oxidoreductase [Candidatus Saccharicenans subterraneus]|uniref:Fe-S oxidoreductase n=1 Tax=Candidatus Saccharicenans subterraneus TaxID=2508984 RepID=A0A3E2BPA9_9BACT|nr:MAG: Fe-S oxidoreductase [Candidatus Saccharicenans subterraneum]
MLTLAERIILTVLILATFVLFFFPVVKRVLILARLQAAARFDSLLRRFFYTVSRVFLQLCTLKNERPWTGAAHLLIFYGALAFDTMTINHVIEGYVEGFYLFGQSWPGRLFSASVDLFSITVLAGVAFFAIKRFIIRPRAYDTGIRDSALIYLFIFLAVSTFLLFNLFSVALHPGSRTWAFLSRFLAENFLPASVSTSTLEHNLKLAYWLHALAVFSFISYVPHSKYFHLFAGPVNLFFRRNRPTGQMLPLDLEQAETFGAEKATDFSWKDGLDALACVECGRCQDVCPAFQSGKALSPKMVILNLEKHLLAEYKNIKKGGENLPALVPGVFTEEEIWACTTCGACLHVCPFDIEHPDKLLSLRQSLVLAQGRFPGELRKFFHNLETYGNPWGLPTSKRAELLRELGLKTLGEYPEAEYLLWLGCFGSFDDRGRQIAGAMVRIMKSAGLKFAVLGEEERCCGDSARRLGNEYLFQTLASSNMKSLARFRLKGLVTFCPHGYNVFKNDYPALLEVLSDLSPEEKERILSLRVISHLELLASLIERKRLPLQRPDESGTGGSFTIHDSCYYGRHNRLLAEPRKILGAVLGENLRELKNSGEHSFCCGAGGGLMWTEEKAGRRVNHLRSDEIIRNGSRLVATSCPFCLTMLQDGLRDRGADEFMVLDVAEILAAALLDSGADTPRS